MATPTNLRPTEIDELTTQYAHVSKVNAQLMAENLRLRDAMTHLIADMAGIAPTVPQPHHKRMCAAIERAKGRVQS